MSAPCYGSFGRGHRWWPVNSSHKVPATQKTFRCCDVIVIVFCSGVLFLIHWTLACVKWDYRQLLVFQIKCACHIRLQVMCTTYRVLCGFWMRLILHSFFPLRSILTGQWHQSRTSVRCSGANQRKHGSYAWLAFGRGIHRFPSQRLVTRKMFPCNDVILSIWPSLYV